MTQKACGACGGEFSCSAPELNCWCKELTLAASTLEVLREKYSGCLCPRCLAAIQEAEQQLVEQPADASPRNPQ